MHKFLAFAALACSLGSVSAAQAGDEAAPDLAPACTERNPTGGDIRIVSCTLPPGRAHRLTFRFGGGHDDTSASLDARLDGQPTKCDAGSKTSLFGEDGDVSLHCGIAAGDGTAPRTLVVTVLWSHAQYRDFLVAAE